MESPNGELSPPSCVARGGEEAGARRRLSRTTIAVGLALTTVAVVLGAVAHADDQVTRDCLDCAAAADAGGPTAKAATDDTEAEATGLALLFDTRDFPPRWHCGTWSSVHGWTHIIADIVTWIAYLSIPIVLLWVARRRPDFPFRNLFLLFGLFIVACGFTHFFEAVLFWWPAYRLLGAVKVFTAVVSLFTAVVLARVMPDALALRSPAQLEADVSERTRELQASQDELRIAKDEADAANRSKTEFLANMSHEIRTPLTAVLGFASVLLEECREPAALAGARTIQRNGEHLLGVLNDILDLSKIEAGKFDFDCDTIDPRVSVTECVDLFKARADEKGVVLRGSVDSAVPGRIHTDGLRAKQVLLNLLGNALKFTMQGTVELRVTVSDDAQDQLRFDVIDSGVGMNDHAKAQIFDAFVQAEPSTSRRFAGTGLGLTISARIAEGLGGTLDLVRSAPGEGSHFRLQLPMNLAAVRERAEPSVASGHVTDDLEGMTVVLAEDSLDSHRLIKHFLTKAGMKVASAYNGREAFQIVEERMSRSEPPDVVVMDMQMPELDGYASTRLIRERGYRGPIMALTAHAMHDHRARCLEAGCDTFHSKPIDRRVLLEAIAEMVVGHRV